MPLTVEKMNKARVKANFDFNAGFIRVMDSMARSKRPEPCFTRG